jgi:parallel beta-helix repeat protein
MSLSFVRGLFRRRACAPRAAGSTAQLCVESLEERYAPATIRVGPNDLIQPAINRAQAGDTIEISGKHTEQIVVTNETNHSRNNLKIVGANSHAIIAAPAKMTGGSAVVEIRGAKDVTIKCLTVAGPNLNSADPFYGILVDAGGSAKIMNNHITGIADKPLSGLQRGVGIQVGLAVPNISKGTATITCNVIDHYQKNGIQVSGAGSNACIQHNAIVGIGPTSLIAQNGVQVNDGATARIEDNCITGNSYKPEPFAATAVLLLSPGAVTVHDNSLTKNDIGVFVVQSKADVVIDDNYVASNYLIGIMLDTSSGVRVAENTLLKNGTGHAGVDGGISLFNAKGNRIENNVSQSNKGAGIYVESDSTGNTFSNNQLSGNTILDAEEHSTGNGTLKTGNTWTNNFGTKSNPKGLLKAAKSNRCDR